MKNSLQIVELLEHMLPRTLETQDELLNRVLGSRIGRIQTVNLHDVELYCSNKEFAEATIAADSFTADGWPVRAALRLAGRHVDRVTGSELMIDLLRSNLTGQRIGLLGGTEHAGELLERKLTATGGALVFRDHRDRSQWDGELIASRLVEAGAKHLLVAVTPPHGEIIAQVISASGFDGNVVGVGGGLDMCLGLQPTAPYVARSLGLEWLHRLANSPRRLWRRYLVDSIPLLPSLVRAAYVVRTRSEGAS